MYLLFVEIEYGFRIERPIIGRKNKPAKFLSLKLNPLLISANFCSI